MTYARRTTVTPEKSRVEIERLLRKHKADQIVSGWEADRAMVGFRMNGRYIRMSVSLKESSRRRPDNVERERLRAMVLVLKAKLEGIAAGVVTFEEEFLAHVVMPDGQTIGRHVLPRIAEAYKTGKLPSLLPAAMEANPCNP